MRPLLSTPSVAAAQRLDRLQARQQEAADGGPPLSDAEERGYGHSDVKDSLRRETLGKCAYCESYISAVYWGDVEHILPKSSRPDLRFEYDNLTFACARCNSSKGDYYDPVLPLINPYEDNPDNHFLCCGPMILSTLHSERGEVTIVRLDLNRKELVERRQERIEALDRLARRYSSLGDGSLKQAIREQVLTEVEDDKSYTAHCKTLLWMLGVL